MITRDITWQASHARQRSGPCAWPGLSHGGNTVLDDQDCAMYGADLECAVPIWTGQIGNISLPQLLSRMCIGWQVCIMAHVFQMYCS